MEKNESTLKEGPPFHCVSDSQLNIIQRWLGESGVPHKANFRTLTIYILIDANQVHAKGGK